MTRSLPYFHDPNGSRRGSIRVAGLQLSGVEGNVAANLAKVEAAMREAASRGAQIALTPEAFLSGYSDAARSRACALDVPGPETDRVAALCADLGLHVILGLVSRNGKGYSNTCVLIGPAGVIGSFSKVHINRYEIPVGYINGDRFPTWDLNLGGVPVRVGIMICYDREVPEAARLLMLQGVDVIFNPLACGCPAEDIHRALIRVRAYENEVYLFMVNHAAPRMNGLSMVVHPNGDLIHGAGNEEEVFACDLDLGELDEHRQRGIYGFHHRRPELYAPIAEPPS